MPSRRGGSENEFSSDYEDESPVRKVSPPRINSDDVVSDSDYVERVSYNSPGRNNSSSETESSESETTSEEKPSYPDQYSEDSEAESEYSRLHTEEKPSYPDQYSEDSEAEYSQTYSEAEDSELDPEEEIEKDLWEALADKDYNKMQQLIEVNPRLIQVIDQETGYSFPVRLYQETTNTSNKPVGFLELIRDMAILDAIKKDNRVEFEDLHKEGAKPFAMLGEFGNYLLPSSLIGMEQPKISAFRKQLLEEGKKRFNQQINRFTYAQQRYNEAQQEEQKIEKDFARENEEIHKEFTQASSNNMHRALNTPRKW